MFNLDKNGKIEIDPNILMIPSLNKIWKLDKSKTKELSYNIFSGVYFLCSPNSPYWNWQEDKKIKEIQEQYFDKAQVKLKDSTIQELIKDYKVFLNTNPSQILLEAAKETLYKLADHLKKVPITSGKDGNIMQVANTMDKIGKTLSSYDSLKEAVERDKMNTDKKRGNSDIGLDEL